MARKFDKFMDLTGLERELKCIYHGAEQLHLEGRIIAETDSEFVVGVNFYEDDILKSAYDADRKSLDLWYKTPVPGTMRIMLLPMSEFGVPKDIEEINVYDAPLKPELKKKK